MVYFKSLKNIIYILIWLLPMLVFPQKKDSLPLNLEDYILVKRGDTLNIQLDEITILPKHKFNSITDQRYYYWFRTKVFKAYPYAVLAAEKIDSIHKQLEKIEKRRHKRRYVRKAQKFLEKEFTDQLKKMTRTEGRILIKLIHRQTGKTAYQNIRELRSGWRAFWYNTTANLFKLSLKNEYSPGSNNEDYLTEDVLQRAFMEARLKSTKAKIDFDFPKIAASKKGQIDVEEYKEMFAKQKKKKKKK